VKALAKNSEEFMSESLLFICRLDP